MTVTLDDINHDYKRLAHEYDARWQRFLSSAHGYVLDRWPEENNQTLRVFDAGCGTGHLLQQIHSQNSGHHLRGIDACPDMLARAQKAVPKARFTQDNIEDFEITDQHIAYDIVLSMNVLHHLNNPHAHLDFLISISRPGGHIFICDFALSSLPMRIAEIFWRKFHRAHNKAFTPRALYQIIKGHERIKICDHQILNPTRFWRLQAYKIEILP